MSQTNGDGKRAARERVQAERERQGARERQRRTLIVLAAAVGVLAVVAVVGVVVSRSGGDSDDGPVTYPKGATGKDRLALPVGRAAAPATLTVYEDFRCPACGQFESAISKTIHELEDAGKLRTEYRLVTLIDDNFGGEGSLRAASAAACAQDAGKFTAYHDVLFRNQPPESDDAFAAGTRLKELAGEVPGLSGGSFTSCVDDGTYDGWVRMSDAAFDDSGHGSTPTVLLDGESIFGEGKDLTPTRLRDLVDEAAS